MNDAIIEAEYTDRPRAGARGLATAPHDQELRDLAYRIWSEEGRQQTTETLRILASQHGHTLAYRTLRRWISDDDWSRRLLVERLEFTPSTIKEELLQNMAESALIGSRYVRDALRATPLRDEKGNVQRERTMADAASGPGTEPSGPVLRACPPSREMNQLAELALTRFLGKGDTGLLHALVEARPGEVLDVAGMTDDELARVGTGEVTARTGHAT